jgi:hypothetical protein
VSACHAITRWPRIDVSRRVSTARVAQTARRSWEHGDVARPGGRLCSPPPIAGARIGRSRGSRSTRSSTSSARPSHPRSGSAPAIASTRGTNRQARRFGQRGARTGALDQHCHGWSTVPVALSTTPPMVPAAGRAPWGQLRFAGTEAGNCSNSRRSVNNARMCATAILGILVGRYTWVSPASRSRCRIGTVVIRNPAAFARA